MEELRNIQAELKAPKGQYNSFGKYHYRSAEDILEAVKPLLTKYGVLMTITDDVIAVADRIYVKATVTIENSKGVSKTVNAYAREPQDKKGMDDSQITGTASSYARKYALNGMFLIDDTKDADTDEYAEQTKAKPKAKQTQPPICKVCGKPIEGATDDSGVFRSPYEVQKMCNGVCVQCFLTGQRK
jgi:hypothetical protein